jgi:hypothetical protein
MGKRPLQGAYEQAPLRGYQEYAPGFAGGHLTSIYDVVHVAVVYAMWLSAQMQPLLCRRHNDTPPECTALASNQVALVVPSARAMNHRLVGPLLQRICAVRPICASLFAARSPARRRRSPQMYSPFSSLALSGIRARGLGL